MRGIGAVSPSVISAVSSGAHPSNSAATRAAAPVASVKSMPAIHSAGQFSSTYVCRMSPASRCATIPFPGASAYMAPPPTASATAECRSSASYRYVSMNVVPVYSGLASDSSGRIFDQAPSAPTRRPLVTVGPWAKVELVPAVAEGLDIGDLASPLDHLVGQGVEQDPTQVSAEHLGTPSRAVVGVVEQHRAVLVEHARRLAALVDDRAELLGETGRFERELPVVLVDVELAALCAGLCRGLRLVDGGGDAVDVEEASEGEAAEARTDDGDWRRHDGPFVSWLERCSKRTFWNSVPAMSR